MTTSERKHRFTLTHLVQFVSDRRYLCVILVLAAGLRLYSLDLIDFRFDEASAPQFALSIAQGHWLAIAPFSGSVANHPPVYLYALAIPYLFTRDLMLVAAYRALLDALAIAVFWFLCERFFTRRIAWIASLAFAIAPWAVQFSRKLWLAPLPLFSVILLFGLLEIARHRNPWGWTLTGWGLALCVGAHLSALYLVPVVIITLVLGYRTFRVAPTLLGLAPLAALALVYIQFDAGQNYANVNALFGAAQTASTFSLDSLQFAMWSSGGMHLSDLTDGAYGLWQAQVPAWFDWLDTVQVVLLFTGLAFAVAQLGRRIRARNWQAALVPLVLLAWWCLPVILQLQHGKPLQIHYLTPIYPAPFLLMALPIDRLLAWQAADKTRAVRKIVLTAAVALLILVGVWQVFTTLRFADFIEQYDTSAGGYGQPVRGALNVTSEVRGAACDLPGCALFGAPNDVIVVTPGGDPLVNEQATIMNVVLAGVPHRFANSDAGIILPSDTAQYIFTPGTDTAMHLLLENVEPGAIFSRTVAVRAGSHSLYTYVRVAEPVAHNYIPTEPARWANGIELSGYRLGAGQVWHLEVFLKVTRPPAPGADYHWYNHVLAGDQKIAQLDGGGIQPANWRQGDVLLHYFDIPMPATASEQTYVVRVGSYTYPELQTVPVTTSRGQEDGVSLPVP